MSELGDRSGFAAAKRVIERHGFLVVKAPVDHPAPSEELLQSVEWQGKTWVVLEHREETNMIRISAAGQYTLQRQRTETLAEVIQELLPRPTPHERFTDTMREIELRMNAGLAIPPELLLQAQRARHPDEPESPEQRHERLLGSML